MSSSIQSNHGIEELYLHIPFCQKKCFYCDFASCGMSAANPLIARYAKALQILLDEAASLGLIDQLKTTYIGGGTPTHIGERLIDIAQAVSNLAAPSEFSVEANPESVELRLLEALRMANVSRISLGVQSLNDVELLGLGRIHTAERAREALILANNLGFDVSADVMCAIPYQTYDSFEQTLRELIDLNLAHISCYPLQIEEGTVFGSRLDAGTLEEPSEEFQAECMVRASDLLEDAGFSRYEVASYAKPGKACQHNIGYWSGATYLGLGTHASSMLNPAQYEVLAQRISKFPQLAQDCTRIRMTILSETEAIATASSLGELSFELEFLIQDQMVAEDLMLSCRKTSGISLALEDLAVQVYSAQKMDTCFKALLAQELLERSPVSGCLVPTQKGWLLGNELFGELWSLSSGSPQVITC